MSVLTYTGLRGHVLQHTPAHRDAQRHSLLAPPDCRVWTVLPTSHRKLMPCPEGNTPGAFIFLCSIQPSLYLYTLLPFTHPPPNSRLLLLLTDCICQPCVHFLLPVGMTKKLKFIFFFTLICLLFHFFHAHSKIDRLSLNEHVDKYLYWLYYIGRVLGLQRNTH